MGYVSWVSETLFGATQLKKHFGYLGIEPYSFEKIQNL
jgi:hypothetical protein